MLTVTVALCLAGFLVTSCESTTADRKNLMAMVNQARTASGLAPLSDNLWLDLKADIWARHLRDVCSLSHTDLSARVAKQAENVGLGSAIATVHAAYMESAEHRSNILDPKFSQLGVAAVWGSCSDGTRRVFTVEEFTSG